MNHIDQLKTRRLMRMGVTAYDAGRSGCVGICEPAL